MNLDIMKKLEEKIPPPENCHHALHACRYGSDETGWEDQLGLTIVLEGHKFQTFFLDDNDFNDPDFLIQFISDKIDKIKAGTIEPVSYIKE